jgi:hypothetical protein
METIQAVEDQVRLFKDQHFPVTVDHLEPFQGEAGFSENIQRPAGSSGTSQRLAGSSKTIQSTIQDEAVDSQHGTRADGNSHSCVKGQPK